MGVAIVVYSVVGDTGFGQDRPPEFLEIHNWFVQRLAGKDELGPVAMAPDLFQQRYRRLRERQMLGSFLLCMVRWLDPDAAIEVEILPAGGQNLANPRTRQKLKADRMRRFLVRVPVQC